MNKILNLLAKTTLTVFFMTPVAALPAITKEKSDWTWQDFLAHKKANQIYDQNREKGLAEWQKQQRLQQKNQEQKREDYLSQRKKENAADDESSLSFKLDQANKKAQQLAAAKNQRDYFRDHKEIKTTLTTQQQLEELDLLSERPRFEYRKRAAFGASVPTFAKSQGGLHDFGGSSSGQNGYSPRSGFSPGAAPPVNSGMGGSPLPPPPPFDDFGPPVGNDFIAPAPPAEFNGEEPIPPPVFDGGGFSDEPPPPFFEDEF
ncbi:MAG: hypothetical protein ACOYOK_03525 [Pseudobdellovibrionaceae bacterium]